MADTLLLSDNEGSERSIVTKIGSASLLLARQMMEEPEKRPTLQEIEDPTMLAQNAPAAEANAAAIDAFLAEAAAAAPTTTSVDELIDEVLHNCTTIRVSRSETEAIVAEVEARTLPVTAPDVALPIAEPSRSAITYVPPTKEKKSAGWLVLTIVVDVLALAAVVGPAVYWLFE